MIIKQIDVIINTKYRNQTTLQARKNMCSKGKKNIARKIGVGVRGFYRKKGYTLKNNYMSKGTKC